MSWGERSCLKCTAPEGYCQIQTCNVDCPYYQWDGKTKADSYPTPKVTRVNYKSKNKY